MKLSDLIRRCPSTAHLLSLELDPEVTGVSEDSRQVGSGDLFVAIRGARDDGARHAAHAIARGAVAVVAATPSPSVTSSTPWLTVDDPRRTLAEVAAAFHGRPGDQLRLSAVTGSKGKTTTSFLLARACALAGEPTALLTTVINRTGEVTVPATLTTSSASTLQRLLRQAVAGGDTSAVIEVSSHALDQQRVYGLRFELGVFTNLFPDHLDYHGTVDRYLDAKRRLFEGPDACQRAVVGVDQEAGRSIAERHPHAVTFGADPRADVHTLDVTSTRRGVRVRVASPRSKELRRKELRRKELTLDSPLLGAHNASNLLALTAYCLARDFAPEVVVETARSLTAVPGRMESVGRDLPFTCVVDFAHTGAALRAALQSARQWTEGRVVVVFGAGGNRDPERRRTMGEAAAALADRTYLTSDNPRDEPPESIITAIHDAYRATGGDAATVITDRAEAIAAAVADAKPGDTLIIAGRGHERHQLIADRRIPFDDREVTRAALRSRGFEV